MKIAVNIKWDTDGDMEVFNDLPTEIIIPEGMTDKEEISDYLSDETGFCHEGFELVNYFICKICGKKIEITENDYEEDLWGHLQFGHAEVFEECQNWETPYMIEEYYESL